MRDTMTIATKNGAVIFKDGAAAENCNCCGGWYCYGNPCHDVLSLYGPPFMERASSWSCDGDNIPPDSITVRVTYSGRELLVWLWAGSSDFQGNSSEVVQKRYFTTTSNNFTATLNRTTNYGRYYDNHCYYIGASEVPRYTILEIHPGAKCGNGWDAGLGFSGLFPDEQFGPRMPAQNFTETCVAATADATCAAINAIQQQKGEFPGYWTPAQVSGSGAVVRQDSYLTWSDLPCSTSPNPTLSGFKWSLCFSALSACRLSGGQQSYRIASAPLCTVEVIDAVP